VLWAGRANAQGVDRRYAEEPTDGMALPTAPLAGEHDARTVRAQSGGLALVRGAEMALVLGLEDSDVATSSGQGFRRISSRRRAAAVGSCRGSVGASASSVRPAAHQLTPDPGRRLVNTGFATGWAGGGGLGVSWHHFHDEGCARRCGTFDLGLSTRIGNHVASARRCGYRERAPSVTRRSSDARARDGDPAVRMSTAPRPRSAGGSGRRGWMSMAGALSPRDARVYVHGMFETRELHAIVDSVTGVHDAGGRDYRATLGLEVSLALRHGPAGDGPARRRAHEPPPRDSS